MSTAYYALFHQVVDDACRFLISGNAPAREALRRATRRAFAHGDMKKVANTFRGGNAPQEWQSAVGGAIPRDLKTVADAFFELQEARHEADYDLTRAYIRREVNELVRRCELAFAAWERCRRIPAAEAYLVALLLHKRLRG